MHGSSITEVEISYCSINVGCFCQKEIYLRKAFNPWLINYSLMYIFTDTEYEAALKIYHICADLGLSKEDAKLYTYINHSEREKGHGFFKESQPTSIGSLDVLLGRIDNCDLLAKIEAANASIVVPMRNLLIAENLQELDQRPEAGDYSQKAELKARLRMHYDPDFCKEKLRIYHEMIAPLIEGYDNEEVQRILKVEKLRDELEQAIADERFEEAAKLKDTIDGLSG